MTRKTGQQVAGLRRRVGADTACCSTRRQLLIAIGASALTASLASFAQQPPKIYRIGFLGATSASTWASRVEAFRAGLRDFGYIEGKNISIEFRWAEDKYERLPDLAAELVGLNVDLLVTHGTPGTLAAKRATTTIPIVMALVGDAVASGVVASLARPGGNITGSTFFAPEIMAKRLELLTEVLPRAKRFAVLVNADDPSRLPVLKAIELAARSLKVELQTFSVRGPGEFERAFAAMTKTRVDAVVLQEDSMISANVKPLAELAVKHRIPTASLPVFADAGVLIGYGTNTLDLYRRAAYFADRIFKGAKPGDLPVERPTKFELVVNLKTAKQIGVKIPHDVLARADRVID